MSRNPINFKEITMSAVRDAAAVRVQQPNLHGLIDGLKEIVGGKYVLTDAAATHRYRTGFRFGEGKALAVVRPATVLEQWRVLQACIAANVIVITQASNTGLTGGSTPDGDNYDRGIVIVSTARMKKVYVIGQGKQVVCLPGATLDQLEKTLKPLGREPHSVIGSSCIGASVFGGVCNNSGGALVQRGPALRKWPCSRRWMRKVSCNSSIIWASGSVPRRNRYSSASTAEISRMPKWISPRARARTTTM
jgi:D-lactate dehydrogenase